MIDLKKLQGKFDRFFKTETKESFDAWLEKRMRSDSPPLKNEQSKKARIENAALQKAAT